MVAITSMRGKTVDMDRLMHQNENAAPIVLSDVQVNARGDTLGRNGQIVAKESTAVNTGSHVPTQTINKPAPVQQPVVSPPVQTIAKPIHKPIVPQKVQEKVQEKTQEKEPETITTDSDKTV